MADTSDDALKAMANCPYWNGIKSAPRPDDIVVVRNKDADEAGDYRVMKHCDAVGDPQWEITDIDPADLD